MADIKTNFARPVYVVDGARTPFLKARGRPGPFAASDLGVAAGRALLARQPFSPEELDEVVVGCMDANVDEANIGRIIGLRLGCGKKVPGWTVQRNCGSGMQALDSAAKDIACGRHDLVLAGGTESMSWGRVVFNQAMVNWLADWAQARNMSARLGVIAKFRPQFLAPVIGLIHGLTDPIVGLIMGKTAENLAYQFKISREQMDEFSLQSHQRAAHAQAQGWLNTIVPLYDTKGNVYTTDTGVRADTSLEKLSQLKPFFDKKFGMVTAGNSAQVTDGAALLILASEDAVKRHKLPVLGRIVDAHWGALEPEVMGLGPVYAATPLLQRHQLGLNDIDYWEINEAFAAQVLACLAAWKDEKFCREKLGLDGALGEIDQARLNVDGGSVALGHPVGTSGARIVLRLLKIMERNQAKRGMAAICIGGGQGGAMLLERE